MKLFTKKIFFMVIGLLIINQSLHAQALSQTLVTINYLKTETISETDFRKTLKLIEAQSGTKLTSEERQLLLDKMIDDILVMQNANQANIKVTEGDVIQKLREMGQIPPGWSLSALKEQYNSGELAKFQSWDEMMTSLRNEIAKQNYIVSQIKPRQPTNAEVEKAYADYEAEFFLPTTIGVSHIFFALINMDGTPIDAAEKQRKLKLAQEVAQKISSNALTFEQAVRMYSEDSSTSARLGYIGAIADKEDAREYFGDAFMNSALALRPGQTSQVITSDKGLHIIKITDREEGRLLTLEDPNPYNPNMKIRDLVFQQLQLQYFQYDAEALIQTMRTHATININQTMWSGWLNGSKTP